MMADARTIRVLDCLLAVVTFSLFADAQDDDIFASTVNILRRMAYERR